MTAPVTPKLKVASTSNQQFLSVQGVHLEVRYHRGSKPNSATLIFLHEGLGCIDMWRDFPEKISQATGMPALVYSRQGYGKSDPCDVPRPLSYMHIEAQEVLPALLEVAGIDRHILIGHSDGGSISLINAGSCPAEGLQAVITMAPHIFCEELTVRSIEQARNAYTKDDVLRSKLAKYHVDNVDCAFWGWNKAWLDPDFMNWNIEEFLPGIQVPQLVIQGEEDPYGTMAQVKGIAGQAGGSVDVCPIPDCGHSPYKEQEQQSIDAITRFLAGLNS